MTYNRHNHPNDPLHVGRCTECGKSLDFCARGSGIRDEAYFCIPCGEIFPSEGLEPVSCHRGEVKVECPFCSQPCDPYSTIVDKRTRKED